MHPSLYSHHFFSHLSPHHPHNKKSSLPQTIIKASFFKLLFRLFFFIGLLPLLLHNCHKQNTKPVTLQKKLLYHIPINTNQTPFKSLSILHSHYLPKRFYSFHENAFVYVDQRQNTIHFYDGKKTSIYQNLSPHPIQYIALFSSHLFGIATHSEKNTFVMFRLERKQSGTLSSYSTLAYIKNPLTHSNNNSNNNSKSNAPNNNSQQKTPLILPKTIEVTFHSNQTHSLLWGTQYIIDLPPNESHTLHPLSNILRPNNNHILQHVSFSDQYPICFLIYALYTTNKTYTGILSKTYHYKHQTILSEKQFTTTLQYFFGLHNYKDLILSKATPQQKTLHLTYYKGPNFLKIKKRTLLLHDSYPLNLSSKGAFIIGQVTTNHQLHFYIWK